MGMTREEAREAIKEAYGNSEYTDEIIKALEQEPIKNGLATIHTEGLDEGIRCAMCTNSMKSDRGCDGGCVVNNAMYKKVMEVIENHIVDSNKMVEPTTKNDLGVDCISRQAVVDMTGLSEWFDSSDSYNEFVFALGKLPSVTPQEPKWISVSERLPEDSGEYLVSVIDKEGEEYKQVGVAWFAHPKDYDIKDGEWRELMINEKVIAWMPLPQPYKEVEE